ncbi:MAG: hypothetical protein WCJ64_24835, partial [Rhodospirillaceae bacterium]
MELDAGDRFALAQPAAADAVKTRLSHVYENNRRVRMVALLLEIIALRLKGKAGAAALRRIDKTTDAGKVGAIAMKWREDIHETWTESPVMVLALMSELVGMGRSRWRCAA